jgi:phosphatidylglycerophosphatase A
MTSTSARWLANSRSTSEAAPAPSLRLMLSHPAHLVSFGLGCGLARFAPGTFGTLGGWAAFIVLAPWMTDAQWPAAIGVAFALGALAAQKTGRALGKPDHGAIVIDEVVAFWLVLWLLPRDIGTQVLAFIAFRFFDIVKPEPIRAIDRRLKNGVGVMIDDLLAAVYTLLFASILIRIFG